MLQVSGGSTSPAEKEGKSTYPHVQVFEGVLANVTFLKVRPVSKSPLKPAISPHLCWSRETRQYLSTSIQKNHLINRAASLVESKRHHAHLAAPVARISSKLMSSKIGQSPWSVARFTWHVRLGMSGWYFSSIEIKYPPPCAPVSLLETVSLGRKLLLLLDAPAAGTRWAGYHPHGCGEMCGSSSCRHNPDAICT